MPEIKEAIYEPRKFYDQVLKDGCHEEAIKYFDELVKNCGVDEEQARLDAKKYYEAEHKLRVSDKRVSKYRGWRVFIWIVIGFLAIVGLFLAFNYTFGEGVGFLVGAIFAFLGAVGLLIYLLAIFNKKVKEVEMRHQQLEKKTEEAKTVCYKDLIPLNGAYDWNAPADILKKVSPILDVDRYFSAKRFRYLVEKFGFPKDFGPDTSILGIVSGNIQGNPFVLEKDLNCDIVDIPYHGSLTISWTERYTDSKGETHTTTKTQTLHATTYHKGPRYEHETRLLYGNEAAPNLSFHRSPCHFSSEDQKALDRFIKKRTKELQKKAKHDLMDGDSSTNYTMMGNNEFEAVFGATDRNNEVEFRLLYTPLAQKNVMDLLLRKEPYGDDFVQMKDGMLNSVASAHSQHFDYSANPAVFIHFDIDEAKKNFVQYCDDYVRGLYFDLAPLLSIPLYQSHMPEDYIYETEGTMNFAGYEHEVMVNGMDPDFFRPEEADRDLPVILKIIGSDKEDEQDRLIVKAYSFETTPMLEYVSMMGGDGYLHEVPVHWIRYDYVEKDSEVGLLDTNESRPSYAEKLNGAIRDLVAGRSSHFERGLLCYGLFDGENVNQTIRSFFQREQK